MHEDIRNLREEFDGIEVPAELDLVIERAIRKGQRARKFRYVKPFSGIAATLIIFIFTVNASPAFAGLICSIPGMESIIRLVTFDRGLIDAANNGVGQVINKSITNQGITVSVESAIFDGRNLILAYEIKTDKNYFRLGIPNFIITDSRGKRLEVSTSHGSPDGENTNIFKGLITIGHEGFVYPEDVILHFSSIKYVENVTGEDSKSIDGNWSIPFKLDKKLATIEPRHMVLNKEFTVENLKFTLEELTIYPTVVDLKITFDKNNPLRVTTFRGMKLIDEKGNEYKEKGASLPENQYIAHFESGYFNNPSSLTLAFEKVYTMPWEDQYLVIDVENERFIEDGGYDFEFLEKRYYTYSDNDKKTIGIRFRPRDKEIQVGTDYLLWLDTLYDEKNNPIDLFSESVSWDGDRVESILNFEAEKDLPKIIKTRIRAISKGIVKPVRIKLY